TNVVRSDLCTDEKAGELGISQPAGGGGGGGGGFHNTVKPMMDLAVMNALCNQNAIMMLMMPGTANMHFLVDSTIDSHGLSHRIGDPGMGGTCVAGVLGMLEQIDIWHAEQFAYLVGKLDSVTETEGATVLDNSATVWLMEQSDGQAHNLNNMPIL